MKINKAFALKFSKIMYEKGISKYKLEKKTGLSHATFRNIFNEVNSDIMFSTIINILSALGIELKDFFDDELFDYKNLDY